MAFVVYLLHVRQTHKVRPGGIKERNGQAILVPRAYKHGLINLMPFAKRQRIHSNIDVTTVLHHPKNFTPSIINYG